MNIPADKKDTRWGAGMSTIQFGSPGKNCSGHGICRIEGGLTLVEVPELSSCAKATAIVRMLKHRRLRFHILKSSVCNNTKRRYFSKPFLQIHDPVEVLMHHWPVKAWEVTPGTYTIRERETHFELHVQVVPQETDKVACLSNALIQNYKSLIS